MTSDITDEERTDVRDTDFNEPVTSIAESTTGAASQTDSAINEAFGPLWTESAEDNDEDRITPNDGSQDQVDGQPVDQLEQPLDRSPLRQEELVFTEPTDKPPLEMASILSKFGYDASDEPEERESGSHGPDEANKFTAQGASNIESDSLDLGSDASSEMAQEDLSIHDYMSQLMQRVSGSASGANDSSLLPTSNTILNTKTAVDEAPSQTEVANAIEPTIAEGPETTLKPEDFRPRSQAPEQSSSLQAMRDLANQMARTAIDRHTTVERGDTALTHLAFAGVGTVSSGFSTDFLPARIVTVHRRMCRSRTITGLDASLFDATGNRSQKKCGERDLCFV